MSGHVDRHLGKTDVELITRLLVEWKLCIGCLLKDYTEEILTYAKTLSLVEGDNILLISFAETVGYGFDRWFKELTSNTIRAVVIKQGNELILHTAYPDLDEHGTYTGKCFDFSKMGFEGLVWNIFEELHKEGKYMVRYIPRKNPQLRVYIDDYSFVYNGKTLRVYHNDTEIKTELANYYVNHPIEIPQLYEQLTSATSNPMFLRLMLAFEGKKAIG